MGAIERGVALHVRSLGEEDAPRLDAYLCHHISTSLAMLSNLRRGGLVCDGLPFQAHYLAAVDRHGIHGTLSLGSDDLVLLQCPRVTDALPLLLTAWGEWFDGGARALAGPVDQVEAALALLKRPQDTRPPDDALPIRLRNIERVYGVSPERVILPPEAEAFSCRLAAEDEFAELCAWRLSFLMDVAKLQDSEALRQRVHRDMLDAFERGELYVLSDAHLSPVAMATAVLSVQEAVQIGGFYVPPDLRRRGYFRILMAQLAVWLGRRGVSVVSFLSSGALDGINRAAETLGYLHKGDFELVLFDRPISPSKNLHSIGKDFQASVEIA